MKTNQILVAKWGYDQTNVDFYKVVKSTDKFATVVKLESCVIHNGDMTYVATPTSNIQGESFRRKIHTAYSDEQFVYITDYERAYIASSNDIEFGVKGTCYA